MTEISKSKKVQEEIVLPDGVTQEQIKSWKERYGDDKVKLAILIDFEGRELCSVIVRVPGRQERSEFEKWIDKNPGKAKDVLINACLLSSKDEVKANDDKYEAAYDAIAKLFRISTSTIKNL